MNDRAMMAGSPPAPGTPLIDIAPELDTLVAESIAEWKVPGLAVAVVHNGAVVVLKAYGQRDIEAGLPVTLDTQFIICSITKTFTATGLALLVDERRLDWARPVRDYVPEFRLHDDVATDRLTVRDLLCHHSGLPRHDWIWLPGDLTRAQMFAAMRYLEPSRDLRSVHQYSNLGYLVAGIVTERISGTNWEEFIRARLTDKLRMNVSFAAEDLARSADGAVPYTLDGDKRLRFPLVPISVAPAGAINASISGMANWARFLLGAGELDGQRLLSASLVREMQTPRVHVATSEFSEIGDTHYGLGFRCHHYRGERAVGHSGGFIGWNTLMTLLPDHCVGVVVLTNSVNPVSDIVTNFLLDRSLDKPPVPWFDRLRERRRTMLAQSDTDRQTRSAARRAGTRPSHDLAEYVGDYEHPGYGRIAITQAGKALHWAYRGMSATLEHRHYDTFDLPEAPERLLPDRLPITFATDREGNIARLSAPFEPLVTDIVFELVASGACTEAAFRKSCTGVFRHGAVTNVVAQDTEGQLTLSIANQPTYRLRPFRGGIFIIVELPGFRVEFRRAADGAIDEQIFHQPNGTFLAQRIKQVDQA